MRRSALVLAITLALSLAASASGAAGRLRVHEFEADPMSLPIDR